MSFGVFTPLHTYLLRAQPYSFTTSCVTAHVLPFVLYFAQAWLLLRPGTLPLRAAVGAIAIATVGIAWSGWRFTDPQLDPLNVSTWIWFALVLRLIDWSHCGHVRHLVFDNRFMAALDLCINWRWVGVVEVDDAGSQEVATSEVHTEVPTRSGNGNASPQSSLCPPCVPAPRPISRPAAVLRHVFIVISRAILLDACAGVLSILGPLVAASNAANVDPLVYAQHHATMYVFRYYVPPRLAVIFLSLTAGGAGYAFLSTVYHTFAALGTATVWPESTWPDFFNQPWLCDSMCDLWGRRWHQLFNHTFTASAVSLATALGLAPRSFRVPFAYVLSTALHALGNITAADPPTPGPIALFFGLVGIACIAETQFKALTGRRVRGLWGRVWTWGIMLSIIPEVVGAWLRVVGGQPAGPIGDIVTRRIDLVLRG